MIKNCWLLIFLIFFFQYSFGNNFITNTRQTDGFGSQFQNIIATAVYAELNGKNYIYTPFSVMEHNYNSDSDFIAKKEWLINFKDNFEINTEHTAYPQSNCKQFFDAYINQCAQSASLKKIKQIFRANKDSDNWFNNDNFNIAIHVRRPNSHDSRIDGTNTPDQFFLNIIDKLRKIYWNKNILFHLYSQGKMNEFKIFDAPDIVLHINEEVEESFISMVLADVLVTSASSFSYTAGLLSEGTVYYIPFWHSALPNWINVHGI